MSADAVVVDVPRGEILAIANRRAQNPNDSNGLRIDSFTNHAAMDAIEPGSVFKPFVAAAALEEGLVQPETIIDCEGGAWLVGRKVIHDDHPKGDLDVTGVIKYSSNI
ncbi:MAG: penicillin-binding transpeptidase domain-containing protein, partial [bacterium]